MEKKVFGVSKNKETAYLYRLTNKKGNYIEVTDFGACLVSVVVSDRNNRAVDVVLGYDDISGYEDNPCYFGATIGRNGNRLENGQISILGKSYQLEQNEGSNNLHSGLDGYHKRMWELVSFEDDKITFALYSPNMDQGFPGEMKIKVTYEWDDEDTLTIHYEGESQEATWINMTNHSYFNLGGHNSGSILNHKLQLQCDAYTPIKAENMIPTGEIKSVDGTAFDFREERKIGQRIDNEEEQLIIAGGYDHNMVISDYQKAGGFKEFARCFCSDSGIGMTVSTDLPGVQFYAGNFITEILGKDKAKYNKRHGFCLETQYFPNAVNIENFESPLVDKEKKYYTKTSYSFFRE